MSPTNAILLAVCLFLGTAFIFALIVYLVCGRPWIRASKHGIHLSFPQLVVMAIRKVPPSQVVDLLIDTHNAGIVDDSLTASELEAHQLAGGDAQRIVRFMCDQQAAGQLRQSFEQLAKLELSAAKPFDD